MALGLATVGAMVRCSTAAAWLVSTSLMVLAACSSLHRPPGDGDGDADAAAPPDSSTVEAVEQDTPYVPPECASSADCQHLVAGQPCVFAVCDQQAGACIVGAGKDDAPCDDGDVCTLGEHCVQGACTAGAPLPCADGNPCTEDACDAVLGCLHLDREGDPCDDGDPCTLEDACAAGLCYGDPDPACACETDADCAAFEDGDHCNGTLFCVGGLCAVDPASVVTCDASADTQCFQSLCDPATGTCKATFPAGTPCFDGNVCTVGDTCQGGVCVPGPDECACDTDLDCLPHDDGDACNGALRCVVTEGGLGQCLIDPGTLPTCAPLDAAGCLPTACDSATGACLPAPEPDGTPCDDGDLCTAADACAAGQCAGELLACAAPAPCQLAACDPTTGACEPTPKPDGAPCDDGDVCTAADACIAGQCSGDPVPCDDGDLCTDDLCDPALGCSHPHNTAPCEDGEPCTLGDACLDGACVPGPPNPCDDGMVCTVDACVPGAGCTTAALDPGLCPDDGHPCTSFTCEPLAGGCVVQTDDAACDDGFPCTTDACDADLGCVHQTDDAVCDDGVACTTDACDRHYGCTNQPHDGLCDDGVACTADACEPAAGGCTHAPDDAVCPDGDDLTCTVASCDLQAGCVVTPTDTLCPHDAHECTDRVCDPEAGCLQVPDDDACQDGVDCTLDQCSPAVGCVNAPVDALCADDKACTVDLCDTVAGCVQAPDVELCDDGDECTYDVCEPGPDQCKHEAPLDLVLTGIDYERPMRMVVLPDGSVVVASEGNTLDQVFEIGAQTGTLVRRVALSGEVLWTTEVDPEVRYRVDDMVLDGQGRIAMVGTAYFDPPVEPIIQQRVVVIEPTGEVAAVHPLETDIFVKPPCAIADGKSAAEHVVARYLSHSPGSPVGDVEFLGLGASGEVLWSWVFGGDAHVEHVTGVHVLDGGDFLAVGRRAPYTSSQVGMVLRASPDGDVVWYLEPAAPGVQPKELWGIAALGDGVWATVGYRKSGSGGDGYEHVTVGFTAAGDVLWVKHYPNFNWATYASGFAVVAAPSGGFGITGPRGTFPSNAPGWIGRFDHQGDLAWYRALQGDSVDSSNALGALPTGGFVLGLLDTSDPALPQGGVNVRVVQVGEEGEIPCGGDLVVVVTESD